MSDLVSRRPSTTLLPILVKAGGAILLLRLEASLGTAGDKWYCRDSPEDDEPVVEGDQEEEEAEGGGEGRPQ